VGQVSVVAWPRSMDLAIALGQVADRPAEWPGLGRRDLGELRLIVAPDEDQFNRLRRGSIPSWGVGLAFPATRTIVLRADDPSVRQTLTHELGHLALHAAVPGRVPLWFDEGWASWAAGEFNRLDVLSLNFAVIGGRVPDLRQLDGALRGSSIEANTAYALAASAVLELARRNPSGTLEPLLELLEAGKPFDEAVLATTGFTLDRFDEAWRKSVKRRYGLVTWLAATGLWLILGLMVVAAYWYRRERDRPRRAALNYGWDVPEWDATLSPGEGNMTVTDAEKAQRLEE